MIRKWLSGGRKNSSAEVIDNKSSGFMTAPMKLEVSGSIVSDIKATLRTTKDNVQANKHLPEQISVDALVKESGLSWVELKRGYDHRRLICALAIAAALYALVGLVFSASAQGFIEHLLCSVIALMVYLNFGLQLWCIRAGRVTSIGHWMEAVGNDPKEFLPLPLVRRK